MYSFSHVKPKWWQISIFKLALVSLGVFIGAYWSNIFGAWANMFLVAFILSILYVLTIWSQNTDTRSWKRKKDNFGHSIIQF